MGQSTGSNASQPIFQSTMILTLTQTLTQIIVELVFLNYLKLLILLKKLGRAQLFPFIDD